MKIDKRKKYVMVLDVETTNNVMLKGASTMAWFMILVL